MTTMNYKIEGSDLQYVELTLAPGETAVGEPGAMMYADDGVSIETRMGDGDDADLGSRMASGVKRAMTGENFFTSVFSNTSSRPLRVAFAAPSLAASTDATAATPTRTRPFGLAAATSAAVQMGSFVGDVRRGASCNCETHVITPHVDGTHTEGVGHLLDARVAVPSVPALMEALVIVVAPVALESVGDEVAGNHAPDDLVVDELSVREALARAGDVEGATDPSTVRALVVRTGSDRGLRGVFFLGHRNPSTEAPDRLGSLTHPFQDR